MIHPYVQQFLNGITQKTIADRLEETFGPNPCTYLPLTNSDTGERIGVTCDGKRCVYCGPRKKFILWHQTATMGTYAYIARLTSLAEVEQSLEAAKKRKQRNAEQYTYTIVGDDTLGYIIISNVQLVDEQRYMALADWKDRVLDLYHHAVRKLRRSRVLGRMSLVRRNSRRVTGDIPSPWYRRTVDTDAMDSVSDLDWPDLLAELTHLHDASLAEPPRDDLPVPF